MASNQRSQRRKREDEKYYRYYNVEKKFLVPLWAERIIGKQLAFPINNAWAKYYQRSTGA